MRPSPRPWGVLLCSAAAVVFAAPTLVLPADAPTAPKLVFVAIGGVIFALGTMRIRREQPAGSEGPPESADGPPGLNSE